MLCGQIEVGGVSALHVLEKGRLSQLYTNAKNLGESSAVVVVVDALERF